MANKIRGRNEGSISNGQTAAIVPKFLCQTANGSAQVSVSKRKPRSGSAISR